MDVIKAQSRHWFDSGSWAETFFTKSKFTVGFIGTIPEQKRNSYRASNNQQTVTVPRVLHKTPSQHSIKWTRVGADRDVSR